MIKSKSLKYRNVTVSGKICSGTTTLSGLLEKEFGWKHWSAGEFFRDYCKKHNLDLEMASDRSDELSKKVDYGMKESLEKKEKQIIEGWLSGFVAQGVKGVLKVLLICDDGLRIDRLVNRERMGVNEAKEKIKTREYENAKKWTRVYKKEWSLWIPKDKQEVKTKEGWFDFWHPSLYDLVIDTYSNSREETLNLVLKELNL